MGETRIWGKRSRFLGKYMIEKKHISPFRLIALGEICLMYEMYEIDRDSTAKVELFACRGEGYFTSTFLPPMM